MVVDPNSFQPINVYPTVINAGTTPSGYNYGFQPIAQPINGNYQLNTPSYMPLTVPNIENKGATISMGYQYDTVLPVLPNSTL